MRTKLNWQNLLIVLLLVILLIFPVVVSESYYQQILIMILLFSTVAAAWNLLGGYAGQLSLGHAAFFGTGAYTLALLGSKMHVSPWLGLLAGGLMALPLALLIGGICFRLRGPYFTLSTIALAEVLRLVVLNWRSLTNGAVGVIVPSFFPPEARVNFYYLILAITVVTIAVLYWLTKAKMGYYLEAIREDEDTAESIGIDTAKYKMLALLISAFFTAIAGGFYASYSSFIEPDTVLHVGLSVQLVVITLAGGIGTLAGPIIGASILITIGEVFRSYFKQAHLLIYGLLLMAVILFMPDGILGQFKKLARSRKQQAKEVRSYGAVRD